MVRFGAQESYRDDLLQRVEDAARHFVYLHRTAGFEGAQLIPLLIPLRFEIHFEALPGTAVFSRSLGNIKI